jgi:hypothetical protein
MGEGAHHLVVGGEMIGKCLVHILDYPCVVMAG